MGTAQRRAGGLYPHLCVAAGMQDAECCSRQGKLHGAQRRNLEPLRLTGVSGKRGKAERIQGNWSGEDLEGREQKTELVK